MKTIDGIVTTPGRPVPGVIQQAKKLADQWDVPFEMRRKQSVQSLHGRFNKTVIVVSAGKIEAYPVENHGAGPLFFHPNSAMFRAKHWLKFKTDPFVDACRLQTGDTVVDATLGLGSDAQLASLAVGRGGHVTGLEYSAEIACLVSEGLAGYQSTLQPLSEAMKRIRVIQTDHLSWLSQQPSDSADVVYFDPMFQEEVTHSDGLNPVRAFARDQSISMDVINEARRVAKKRVVLKDHFRSSRFEALGFAVQIRPSATYHFGVIE